MLRTILLLLMLIMVIDTAIVQTVLYIDTIAPLPGSNKRIIAVNYTSPGPLIEANLGDTLIIKVINRLNVSTIIHWHGMFQRGTPDMDGANGATQCPIAPGDEFTYEFKAEPAGTAWYHGHLAEQTVDGLYGPLIIRRPNEPNAEKYETEQTLMVADWYDYSAHDTLLPWYLSKENPDGVEPMPNAIIVNGRFTQSLSISSSGSSRIRFRVINAASFSMYNLSIDGLPLHIIELDQVDTKPYVVQSFIINVAQRVSFYVDLAELHSMYRSSTRSATNSIFIRFQAVFSMYPVDVLTYVPTYASPNHEYRFFNPLHTAILSFDSIDTTPNYQISDAVPYLENTNHDHDTNILAARPFHETPDLIPNATHFLDLKVSFALDSNGINRGYMNDFSYGTNRVFNERQGFINETKAPLLYQMVKRPHNLGLALPIIEPGNNLPRIRDDGAGHFLIPYEAVVDIMVYNNDEGEHPFHLHGSNFWIISTSDFPAAEQLYSGAYIQRDVVSIPASGWAKIRFLANNPGAWLFHCHIDWHMAAGLVVAFINAPDQLSKNGFVLPSHLKTVCPPTKSF